MMNLRYLLLLPVLGVSTLFTACETTEVDRVVYSDGGDYDDTDFYYQGSAPYSRSYGVLVVRDGGYYYNRGGRYYAYNRHSHHDGGSDHRRYDRDHDRNRVTYNNTYRNDRVDVRTEPNARYSTTNRVHTGGYHGTNAATRTNVNVQRSGVSTTTRGGATATTRVGATSPQARAHGGSQQAVQGKKGKHDHDHDRD